MEKDMGIMKSVLDSVVNNVDYDIQTINYQEIMLYNAKMQTSLLELIALNSGVQRTTIIEYSKFASEQVVAWRDRPVKPDRVVAVNPKNDE